jgi:hypothetical protein
MSRDHERINVRSQWGSFAYRITGLPRAAVGVGARGDSRQ